LFEQVEILARGFYEDDAGLFVGGDGRDLAQEVAGARLGSDVDTSETERPLAGPKAPVAHDVEDYIVPLLVPGKVLLLVVEDVVRAELSGEGGAFGATHGRHLCAGDLCELHGEGSDPARRAVYEHFAARELPGIAGVRSVTDYLAQGVPDRLHRGERRKRHRGGLLEREVLRHRRDHILAHHRILRVAPTGDAVEHREDPVPHLEASHLVANLHHDAGHVATRYAARHEKAQGAKLTAPEAPVYRVHPGCPDLYEDLPPTSRRPLDLLRPEHLRPTVTAH
jgi:hypothetical protein